jgi:hypothetical protein
MGFMYGSVVLVLQQEQTNMKKLLFSALISGFILTMSCGQSATENTEAAQTVSETKPNAIKTSYSYVFMGVDDKHWFFDATPDAHSIKIGDELDAVKPDGKKMSVRVTLIRSMSADEIKELPVNTKGVVEFEILDGSISDIGGDFYFVDKGAAYPQTEAASTETAQAKSGSDGKVSATLNGKPWSADVTYQGALYYAAGVKMFDKSGKPYMQLAFKSNTAPDDRQLTISIRDFSGTTGKVEKTTMEVLLSGSSVGDTKNPEMSGYKNLPEYASSDFSLNITKWETQADGSVIMDAEFSGELKGVLGSKNSTFSNGKAENVKVTVYNDPY